MAAPSDPLAPAHDELQRQYQQLRRERDDLNRRLNDALGRLAGKDAGAYSLASPGNSPQHDQLVQVFRQFKMQHFRALTESLYALWQKKAVSKETTPAYARAQFRHLLAEKILIEGNKWLSIRLAMRRVANAEMDVADIPDKVQQGVLQELGKKEPPPEVLTQLREMIAKGLHLLQAMRAGVPPACLLVPQRDSLFAPDQHEAVLGCPDKGTVSVCFTVFPGYVVTGSNRVMEKALVYTEKAK